MERAEGVASLHFVDLVYVLDKISLEDLSVHIKPSVLVLGKELENTHREDIKAAVYSIEKQTEKSFFMQVRFIMQALIYFMVVNKILNRKENIYFFRQTNDKGSILQSL